MVCYGATGRMLASSHLMTLVLQWPLGDLHSLNRTAPPTSVLSVYWFTLLRTLTGSLRSSVACKSPASPVPSHCSQFTPHHTPTHPRQRPLQFIVIASSWPLKLTVPARVILHQCHPTPMLLYTCVNLYTRVDLHSMASPLTAPLRNPEPAEEPQPGSRGLAVEVEWGPTALCSQHLIIVLCSYDTRPLVGQYAA